MSCLSACLINCRKCVYKQWQEVTKYKYFITVLNLSHTFILIVVPDVLCVTVVQGQNDWRVTYSSTEICAVKGSTVDISCSYTYPSRVNHQDTIMVKTFWSKGETSVDLKSDPEYSGRVQYICGNNICTLRITDLRERDSAEYKFRFITNQEDGSYTGSTGVTLSVTGNI